MHDTEIAKANDMKVKQLTQRLPVRSQTLRGRSIGMTESCSYVQDDCTCWLLMCPGKHVGRNETVSALTNVDRERIHDVPQQVTGWYPRNFSQIVQLCIRSMPGFLSQTLL